MMVGRWSNDGRKMVKRLSEDGKTVVGRWSKPAATTKRKGNTSQTKARKKNKPPPQNARGRKAWKKRPAATTKRKGEAATTTSRKREEDPHNKPEEGRSRRRKNAKPPQTETGNSRHFFFNHNRITSKKNVIRNKPKLKKKIEHTLIKIKKKWRFPVSVCGGLYHIRFFGGGFFPLTISGLLWGSSSL